MRAIVSRESVFYVSSSLGRIGPFTDQKFADSVAERLNATDDRVAALMAHAAAANAPQPDFVDNADLTAFQSALARRGFSIWHSGGGMTAWKYDLHNVKPDGDGSMPYVLITDSDGSSHTLSNVNLPEGTIADSWQMGLHWSHDSAMGAGYSMMNVEAADNKELIARIEHWLPIMRLAWQFASTIREWSSPAEWIAIQNANYCETDSSICHSHDFYDANEAMGNSFYEVFGRTQFFESDVDQWEEFTAGNKEQHAKLAAADTDLINAAWDYAKREFMTAEYLQHDALETMTAELKAYCAKYGFEKLSADELAVAEIYIDEAKHRAYFNEFVTRWNAAEETAEAIRKTGKN